MEFVFANMDGLVLNSGAGQVMLHRGDVWFADDPFVQSRPELFSETPLFVHSTVGRLTPPATALEAKAERAAGGPVYPGGPVVVPAGTELRRGRGRRASA